MLKLLFGPRSYKYAETTEPLSLRPLLTRRRRLRWENWPKLSNYSEELCPVI